MGYPDRIYEVSETGWLLVYVLSEHLSKDRRWVGMPDMPYITYRMLEFHSDDGWRLHNYESEIDSEEKLHCYTTLSLGFIEKRLAEGTQKVSGKVWMTDIDAALELSKERYNYHFPTGKHYDVVKYFDNCNPTRMNDEAMLYSEAVKMIDDYNSCRKPYWSYEIKVRRD